MIDLKTLNSVLGQLEEERGIETKKILEAIEYALATAYKKEYGKRGQIIRAEFDINTGTTEFSQIKIVADETNVRFPEEEDVAQSEAEGETSDRKAAKDVEASAEILSADDEEKLPLFNPEQHILVADAQRIKKDAVVGDELVFPLEAKDDFGRIAAQTAKQVVIQKIREAEKEHLTEEYGKREEDIVTGSVQRVERGNVFIDLGRAVGIMPYEEQIPGEHFRQGERLRAYLYRVEETPKGVFLRLSRSHPRFLLRLFEAESPEVAQGTVEVKAIAREAGSRSKVAVYSHDEHIDPVGALVGQRGVRVSTVMSELGGEKIDIIEWSEEPEHFIEDALSPAKILGVEITDEENLEAIVTVSDDQQSLAIGRGGQNVRLAAKLTGWRIDIQSVGGNTEDSEQKAETGDDEEMAPVGQSNSEDADEGSADTPTAVGEEETNDEQPTTKDVESSDEIPTAVGETPEEKTEDTAEESKNDDAQSKATGEEASEDKGAEETKEEKK